MQSIFNSFAEFYYLFGEKSNFVICFLVALIAFLVALIFSIFFRGFGAKKKLYFLFFLGGVCFLDFGLEIALSGNLGYSVALIGLSVCFLSIIYSIREKCVISDEQRELVRFIDQKINAEKENENNTIFETDCQNCLKPKELNIERLKSAVVNSPLCDNDKKTNKNTDDLDFSQVKQIIERLSKINLSVTEEKQVQELKTAVEEFKIRDDELLKGKINDGLSALLKIMANYEVKE